MRPRTLAAALVVALMISAAPQAHARKSHRGHTFRAHNVHKLVHTAAPVTTVAAPLASFAVAAPMYATYLPIATLIGAPVMTFAPVAAVAVPAPVMAAPMMALAAPVAMAGPAFMTPAVLGAPLATVAAVPAPFAVTSGAVLPPPSYTGHALVTTGLAPAALGSPLLLSPAPVVPQKQVDYCCGRI